MKKNGLLSRADYSFGPGTSPVAGAALSALSTAAVTAPVYEFTHVSPYWGAVAGVATAGVSVISMAASKTMRRHEGRAMCYRGFCWLGAGLWSWWQLAHHPWSWNGLGAIGVGAAVAATAGWVLQRSEDKAIEADLDRVQAQLAEQTAARQDKLRDYWEAKILEVTRVKVQIVAVELWADRSGYTLEVELPLNGTTIDHVKPHEKALATAAGLKPGCNVLITEVPSPEVGRHVLWFRINTVNAMAKDQHLPEDWEPRTIEDPVPLGVVADSSHAAISVRERCAVVAGESGSGKSTQLNVATKGIVQCVDAVVMAIDTKGGGEYARRWVRAWYEGRADKPALIRVANTDELAELMLAGLVNISNGRPTYYAELMHQQGADKIMPAPDLPEVVCIIDEFKSLSQRAKDLVEEITDKGRSAGVRLVLSTLDPTAGGIPRAIIKQCRERVGMRVYEEATLHHLFDGGGAWTQRFDPASMTHPGMGLCSSNAQTPVQFKGWKMTPADVDRASIILSKSSPEMDAPSIEMFDTVIVPGKFGQPDVAVTNLWERMWHMTLEVMFPNGTGKTARTATVPAPVAAAKTPPSMSEAMDHLGGAMSDLDAAKARLAAALNEADQCADEDLDDEELAESTADRPASGVPGAASNPAFDALVADMEVPAPRERYRQLLQQLGPTGAQEIANRMQRDGYTTTRQTVQEWLAKDQALGKTQRIDDGWIWIGQK